MLRDNQATLWLCGIMGVYREGTKNTKKHKGRRSPTPVNTTFPFGNSKDEEAVMSTFFTILLVSRPSDSGSQTVIWTVDITVNFAGRPDHAEEFVLEVNP